MFEKENSEGKRKITLFGDEQKILEFELLNRAAIRQLELKLEILNEEFQTRYAHNPIHHVESRLKSRKSIAKKLIKKGMEPTVENAMRYINDIAGVRVVCCYIDDVYSVADMLSSQQDLELIKRKDYIQEPNYNGYRSLHLDFRIPIYLSDQKMYATAEVQLRTVAMDFWASLEHDLRYKSDKNIPRNIATEMLRCADDIALIDGKMQAIYKAIRELK
ncbi:MAG: GTP pyrophosphokinase family protein [Ruminococcaceae bacterium]|nr:GTP pyrophosphokinase family protein [Oscillospiraceae bacterium]